MTDIKRAYDTSDAKYNVGEILTLKFRITCMERYEDDGEIFYEGEALNNIGETIEELTLHPECFISKDNKFENSIKKNKIKKLKEHINTIQKEIKELEAEE